MARRSHAGGGVARRAAGCGSETDIDGAAGAPTAGGSALPGARAQPASGSRSWSWRQDLTDAKSLSYTSFSLLLSSPPTSLATSLASTSVLFTYAPRNCCLPAQCRPRVNADPTPTVVAMMAHGPHAPEARGKPQQGLPRKAAGLLAGPQSKPRAGRAPPEAVTAPTRTRRTREHEQLVPPRGRESQSRDLMRRMPPVFRITARVSARVAQMERDRAPLVPPRRLWHPLRVRLSPRRG